MTEIIDTTAGEMRLEDLALEIGDRTWTIAQTGAVISHADERAFLEGEVATKQPYGVVLWPASIALANDLALRDLAGARILELGAGTGLPGLVAASRGARVVQTDRQKLVLHVCARNAAKNGITGIEHRLADWTAWTDDERYDLIIGSDILYSAALHPNLRAIFERNLAPHGTVLIADPIRAASMELLEALEASGWTVRMDRWTVGIVPPPRNVGVFSLRHAI